MFRQIAISAVAAALGFGLPASAMAGQFKEFTDKCGGSPYGPEIAIDPQLSDEKVKEIRNDVTDFIKASDVYQSCITKVLENGPKLDKKDTPERHSAILKRFESEGVDLIDGNQAEKERIAEQFNKLVDARDAAKKGGAKP